MFWLSYECFSILCDAFLLRPQSINRLVPISFAPKNGGGGAGGRKQKSSAFLKKNTYSALKIKILLVSVN